MPQEDNQAEASNATYLSNKQLTRVVELVTDGVLMLDPLGVVRYVNEHATVILGTGREQLLGRASGDTLWQFSSLERQSFSGQEPPFMRVLHDKMEHSAIIIEFLQVLRQL